MQPQDATTLFIFKWGSWVEANRKWLIACAAAAAVVALVVWFMVNQHEARQVAAGQAMTQAMLSSSGQPADAYMKVAAAYPGTLAGQRALLQSAAAMFEAGRYPDAQAQFQKYVDVHPDGEFVGQALLGVAACLDSQGKSDQAASAYQKVISNASDTTATSAAKFGLARIDEAQGRFNDAMVLYQDVASVNTPFASEAAMRLMELKNKMPAAPTATSTNSMAPLSSGQ
ncbi:MAG TPA: tetratricopeptide repeat protein [Verrucomicrobiae bacterium]|nr:tetratricopeptide repeat protein [Verrucomicrobiae bacterium]